MPRFRRAGDTLFSEWSPDLVRSVLSHLTPERVVAFVLATHPDAAPAAAPAAAAPACAAAPAAARARRVRYVPNMGLYVQEK